ncbi:hypothetical protein [Ectobacillus polymachus]|uniref:hypothetical protein n=1 Tax=Ectobacillus polymachus TaxID=1508806 RepID=UPI003A8562F1
MIWIVLYLLYLILVSIVFLIIKKRIRKEKRGQLEFGFILSLAFPIIGLLAALLLAKLRPRQSKGKWLSEYSDYISFTVQNYEDIYVSAKQDMELTPFSTGMQLEQSDIQKQLIVQVSSSSVAKEGKLLKAALLQKDPETVHYAATTIQVLHDRYRKQIDYAKSLFYQDPKQTEMTHQLLSYYMRYLESDLLSPRQMAEVMDECSPIMLQLAKQFANDPIFTYYYGKILMIQGKFFEAEEQFYHLVETYPETKYGYIGLLKIYYDQKRWIKLYNLLDLVAERNVYDHLPYSYQQFVQQMGGIHLEQKL